MLLTSALIIISIQLVCFLIAYRWQTDKLTDISYAGTFILVSIVLFFLSSQQLIHILLLIAICMRGVRLGSYLLIRISHIKRDRRFDEMRGSFIRFGGFWLLQAVTIFVVLLPVILVMSKDIAAISVLTYIGAIIYLFGLCIESIADYQKYQHKKQHPTTFSVTGLRTRARHPNYLGEICVRRGIWIMSASFLSGREGVSIISPIMITFLLLKVSGVPLLEAQWQKKYGDDPVYKKRVSSTNLLRPF